MIVLTAAIPKTKESDGRLKDTIAREECVDMVHGLHGARFSNSTKIDILKF
jgi:hypothetical protein